MDEPIRRTLEELEAMLPALEATPEGEGTLEMIVRRPGVGEREVLEKGELDPAVGLRGDCWLERGSRHTEDGSAEPERQLTLMNSRAVHAVAGDRGRWPLAGDQLYVDLALGPDALPPGSRLRIGEALIEVSAVPHTGCGKFSDRFGVEAARFVNSVAGRSLNLRGINARVLEPGSITVGDAMTVVSGPSSSS